MKDWTQEPAHRIAEAVQSGQVSARLVAEQHLAAIARRNDLLKAYTDITASRALARADAIDAARAQGQPLPVGESSKGTATTESTRMEGT